ncbi:uncharacterized protein LOC109832692 [Asparagus officinalis]|uniref:uncharacterized protein LOC109832692 n=1 Tax=Asparagus officinalis TaxID=4686 RepID=UPI00098E00AE|nr:uncharacterized protein LOC109832692 [Asparagus officinalis]
MKKNKSKVDKEANKYEKLEENEEDMKILEDARDVSQKEEGDNENKREISSIKRAVRKRKRKDGPFVTSPYLHLDQPKEGTKKKRDIQILDSTEGTTKKIAKMNKASFLHLSTIQIFIHLRKNWLNSWQIPVVRQTLNLATCAEAQSLFRIVLKLDERRGRSCSKHFGTDGKVMC